MTIVNTLIENLPLLIDAAVQLVTTPVAGIGNALPPLIPAAVQAIVTIVQGLVDSLVWKLVQECDTINSAKEKLSGL